MEHTYNIPNWNKAKFEKAINSFRRKGLNVKCEELGPSIETVDKVDYMCTSYSIESEVLYQVSGWEFIGTIEHKDSGNIIRKAVNVKVPKRYETAPNECEHCHTIRNRIDTYLVRNTETNEFKQVGKSCLKAYTGLNPAICTLALTIEAEIAKMEIDAEEVILGGYNVFGSYIGYEANRIKRIAYSEINKNGYKKESVEYGNKIVEATRFKVMDLYRGKKAAECTEEEILKVDNWVDRLDLNNDYFKNASVAYKAKYYEPRDLGLVTSLISCYFKDIAKQTEKVARMAAQAKIAADSQVIGYIGQVGDKVEFEVAVDNILFKNEPYTYYGSWTYTHRIIDTNGHIILWKTSSDTSEDKEFPAGTIIKASVKAHKEFRGELQTVVTRGKARFPEVSHPEGTFNLNSLNI